LIRFSLLLYLILLYKLVDFDVLCVMIVIYLILKMKDMKMKIEILMDGVIKEVEIEKTDSSQDARKKIENTIRSFKNSNEDITKLEIYKKEFFEAHKNYFDKLESLRASSKSKFKRGHRTYDDVDFSQADSLMEIWYESAKKVGKLLGVDKYFQNTENGDVFIINAYKFGPLLIDKTVLEKHEYIKNKAIEDGCKF